MKPTVALTLFSSGAYAAVTPVIPGYSPRRIRGMNPHHHGSLRLLHTHTPISTSGVNIQSFASSAESTKGGAILALPDNDLSTVSATIRIPAVGMPTEGPTANNTVGEYSVSFWVGIDSATDACAAGGLLRAGVDIFWDGTLGGAQRPFAWYQGPGQPDGVGFDGGFPVAVGDLVRFTLEAGRENEDEIVVVAENFGQNATHADGGGVVSARRARQVLSAEAGGKKLCRGEAAWMIEDFPLDNRPDIITALANFTSVTFNTGLKLDSGTKKDLTDAQVLDIRLEAQGGRLTSCEVVDEKSLKCARVLGETR